MAGVFISYARRNAQRVAQVADCLGGDGYSLWWDLVYRKLMREDGRFAALCAPLRTRLQGGGPATRP
jgi:hypothetical protein